MDTTLRFFLPSSGCWDSPVEEVRSVPRFGEVDSPDELISPSTESEQQQSVGTQPYIPVNSDGSQNGQFEQPLPKEISRYRIDGEIAHGGMGIVLRGWDPLLDREVAIKMLNQLHINNSALVNRFLEEARITGQLQHPGIVPIHEMGMTADGQPYFVMSFVQGRTLDQVLAARKSVSADLPKLLKIFEQVCHTLAYAHSNDIIHRDIKPSNIMTGEYGVVMVMDWGLAKKLDEPDSVDVLTQEFSFDCDQPPACVVPVHQLGTQFGTVFGTPAYLPPEQAQGEIARVNHRADVFGLGSLLCEILTGYPPYVGSSINAIYQKALKAKLSDALTRLKNCPAERALVEIAERCLQANPEDRPSHAGEVAQAITAFLESDQRRAERDLVRCFDVSLDLFCVAGTDGYFKRVNENFPRVLGYTAEELIARPFLEFVHKDDVEATTSVMSGLAEGQPIVQFRNRYRHSRGHYIWIEWSARSIPEEGVIYAVARDVTEQVGVTSLIADMSDVFVNDFSLTEMLQRCSELLLNQIGDGLIRIWTIQEPNSGPELIASAGSSIHVHGPQDRVPIGPEELQQMILEQQPILSNGVPGDPRLSDLAWATQQGFVAFAGYPLIVAKRLVGLLVVDARHSLSSNTLVTLRSVSNLLSLAILKKQSEGAACK